jgi:hypothetical protein
MDQGAAGAEAEQVGSDAAVAGECFGAELLMSASAVATGSLEVVHFTEVPDCAEGP